MGKYATYGVDSERLYVREGKTVEEIHQILGLSRTTIIKWKKKGKWDAKRKAYLSTPRATVDTLERVLAKKVEQVDQMEPEEINQTVTDGLVKLMAAVRRAKKEVHFRSEAINVMARFGPFVRDREKDKGKVEWLTKMMRAFFEDIRDDQ